MRDRVKKWGVLSEDIHTSDGGTTRVFFVHEWDRNYGWGCRNYVEHHRNLTYSQATAICKLMQTQSENAEEIAMIQAMN